MSPHSSLTSVAETDTHHQPQDPTCATSRPAAPPRIPRQRNDSVSQTSPDPSPPGPAGRRLTKAERDQLVVDNLPLARRIAARFRGRGPDYDDLVQVASAALVGAATRYDPSRCRDFVGYAVPTMTGEIKRYFRDSTWAVRVPRRLQELHLRLRDAASELGQELNRAPTPSELARYLDVPIEQVRDGLEAGCVYASVSLDAPRSVNSDVPSDLPSTDRDEFDAVDWRTALRPALGQLSDRDRRIVYLRFFQELTQDKIARRVGLSQMQVSRILRRILADLRTCLADDRRAA